MTSSLPHNISYGNVNAGRKLRGKVLAVEKTGEAIMMDDNEKWERCVFTLELTRFSCRTPGEQIPATLKGKKVKIVRYCFYDWHYLLGIEKTLEPEETEAIFEGKPCTSPLSGRLFRSA